MFLCNFVLMNGFNGFPQINGRIMKVENSEWGFSA